MAESDELRRLGDAEWNRGNKEMGARYHEQARRAAREESEREARKPWLDAVKKWGPVFGRHGFDRDDIDFTSVKVEAIEAMGNALLALEKAGGSGSQE
jgi:hypothetical protein